MNKVWPKCNLFFFAFLYLLCVCLAQVENTTCDMSDCRESSVSCVGAGCHIRCQNYLACYKSDIYCEDCHLECIGQQACYDARIHVLGNMRSLTCDSPEKSQSMSCAKADISMNSASIDSQVLCNGFQACELLSFTADNSSTISVLCDGKKSCYELEGSCGDGSICTIASANPNNASFTSSAHLSCSPLAEECDCGESGALCETISQSTTTTTQTPITSTSVTTEQPTTTDETTAIPTNPATERPTTTSTSMSSTNSQTPTSTASATGLQPRGESNSGALGSKYGILIAIGVMFLFVVLLWLAAVCYCNFERAQMQLDEDESAIASLQKQNLRLKTLSQESFGKTAMLATAIDMGDATHKDSYIKIEMAAARPLSVSNESALGVTTSASTTRSSESDSEAQKARAQSYGVYKKLLTPEIQLALEQNDRHPSAFARQMDAFAATVTGAEDAVVDKMQRDDAVGASDGMGSPLQHTDDDLAFVALEKAWHSEDVNPRLPHPTAVSTFAEMDDAEMEVFDDAEMVDGFVVAVATDTQLHDSVRDLRRRLSATDKKLSVADEKLSRTLDLVGTLVDTLSEGRSPPLTLVSSTSSQAVRRGLRADDEAEIIAAQRTAAKGKPSQRPLAAESPLHRFPSTEPVAAIQREQDTARKGRGLSASGGLPAPAPTPISPSPAAEVVSERSAASEEHKREVLGGPMAAASGRPLRDRKRVSVDTPRTRGSTILDDFSTQSGSGDDRCLGSATPPPTRAMGVTVDKRVVGSTPPPGMCFYTTSDEEADDECDDDEYNETGANTQQMDSPSVGSAEASEYSSDGSTESSGGSEEAEVRSSSNAENNDYLLADESGSEVGSHSGFTPPAVAGFGGIAEGRKPAEDSSKDLSSDSGRSPRERSEDRESDIAGLRD